MPLLIIKYFIQNTFNRKAVRFQSLAAVDTPGVGYYFDNNQDNWKA